MACASYQLSGDKNARALLARAFSFLREWRRKTRVVKKLVAARVLLKQSRFLVLINVSVSAAFN